MAEVGIVRETVKPSPIKPLELAKDESTLAGKLHSITFYMPKNKNKFFSDALKEVSRSIYGFTPTGKVSKYLRSLIKKDLIARGLCDKDGKPKPAALANLKKNNAAAK